MKKLWLALAMILLACASEKKPLKKESEQEPGSSRACPSGYAPISLFRDGLESISTPDALPSGAYEISFAEVYVKELNSGGGGFEAHFSEEKREDGILPRQICSGGLDPDSVQEIRFSSVVYFDRDTANARSYIPSRHILLGERGAFRLTRPESEPVRAGGLQDFLARWEQWKIYQLNADTFEFRVIAQEVSGGLRLGKRMVLRFKRAP